jgi:pimeloyl-ACP methyl ester carboxylesterase
VHEFAGDLRSWEPQLRHFGRRYRCVAFNARGYPPSDVPESPSSYSQTLAAEDIKAVIDHLGIDNASWPIVKCFTRLLAGGWWTLCSRRLRTIPEVWSGENSW